MMMKKWIAVFLIFALTACGAMAEAADPVEAFRGLWADPAVARAELSIVPMDAAGKEFAILLTWGNSAAEHAEWTMRARCEDGALVYENGQMADVTLHEDGAPETVEVRWQDAEGRFTPTGDGRLLWEDSREESAADLIFERQLRFAPTVDELSEGFVKPIAALRQGTAGDSLKLAEAACAAARFAGDNLLWNADIPALRENLKRALELAGEADRAQFEAAFADVEALVGDAFADYDACRGSFDDAGCGEEMARMAGDPEAAQSWRTLAEAVKAN